ncbi:MAG: ATP-grasp domain-containing protein [Gemmatimonas sp.]
MAITIARSLHKQNIPVDVGTLSASGPALTSRAIRRCLHISPKPDATSDEVLHALTSLIRDRGYDMVIPANDTSLGFVAKHYDSLSPLTHLACPEPHVVARVLQKEQTLAAARRVGIAVPLRFEVADVAGLDAQRNTLRFPVVAKGESKTDASANTFKVRYYRTFEELRAEVVGDPSFGKRHLLQEFCPGVGVGHGILLNKGEPVAVFQHRRLKELPSTGGVSVLAISEAPDPALLKQSIALLRALEWQGIAMVEYRYDRDTRRAVLMEINGRYWGTFSMATRAGLDLPYYEWQLAHGQQPQPPSAYHAGTKWRWTAGYLQRVHDLLADPPNSGLPTRSRFVELLEAVPDLTVAARSAVWSLEDPLPAIAEVTRTLKSNVVRDVKSVVRRILPTRLVKLASVSRNLETGTGGFYFRSQLMRGLGVRRDNLNHVPRPVRSVLFVCHGNILRSAMAEAIMRQQVAEAGLTDISIRSAGVAARAGKAADPRGIAAARAMGFSLDKHQAQPVSPELVQESDLIIVMDFLNEARMLTRFRAARGKVFMLSPSDRSRTIEVPDPYAGTADDVRRCYDELVVRVHDLTRIIEVGRP